MAKNPGHRPRRNTPEQVQQAVEQMIQEYETTKDIRALHDIRLLEILGNISIDTLERYYNGKADAPLLEEQSIADNNNTGENSGEYKKPGYSAALKKLISYRQLTCMQHLTSDRFNTGWIFLSKQPHWGGFQDVQRVEKQSSGSFTVCIAGADGKPLKE